MGQVRSEGIISNTIPTQFVHFLSLSLSFLLFSFLSVCSKRRKGNPFPHRFRFFSGTTDARSLIHSSRGYPRKRVLGREYPVGVGEKVARFLKFTRHGFRCSFASRRFLKRGGSKRFDWTSGMEYAYSLYPCHIVKNPWIDPGSPSRNCRFVPLIHVALFLFRVVRSKFFAVIFLLIWFEANINFHLLNESVKIHIYVRFI